ncbi:helix-turn-helix domain-containing protein [Cytobacillus oceanisediminis]|uniref:helix-turn-helix domain-containing protein n=1 Tax=Cytobacillus oceanisediminis TaxID=665099 RepID=UPI0037354DE2
MKVRNKLAVRMAEKGIRSVSELHRMIQDNGMTMSRRTLDKFYNNESNRIDWDTLATLCTILECDNVGELLYLEKDPDTDSN